MRHFFLIATLIVAIFSTAFSKEAEEASPKEVLQKITFYTESFPPFTYEDEKGVMEGYAVAVIERIFQNLKLSEPDFRLKVWDMAYMLTLVSKNPSALFLVSVTPAREKQFNFSDQILETRNAIYCNKNAKIKITSKADLLKYKYAVEKQDINISLLEALGVPEKNIIMLGSVEAAAEHIAAGHLDCMAFSQPVIEDITKEKGQITNNIELIYELPPSIQAVAFNHKVSSVVIMLFNKALADVLNDKAFITDKKQQYGVK